MKMRINIKMSMRMKLRISIKMSMIEPGVEENDSEEREKEVEEGGGKHHVQRVACEFLLKMIFVKLLNFALGGGGEAKGADHNE